MVRIGIFAALLAACASDRPADPRTSDPVARAFGVTALPELASAGEVAIAGGTIQRFAQVVDGIPVWDGELRVLSRASGELARVRGTAVDATLPHGPAVFTGDEAAAIARVTGGKPARSRALRRWLHSHGTLRAVWVVEALTLSDTGGAFRAILDGATGRELSRVNLEANDFAYRVWAETTGDRHPLDGPIADPSPGTAAPTGFVPPFVAPRLVTVNSLNQLGDPWLPAGATETVGNNVDAYNDAHAPSGLSAGDFRASVTSPGAFDRTYDLTADPLGTQAQQMAAITSLFYTLNWLHDFWYDAGFTEAAGNAQQSNYGRGGVEGDPILAEAQDNALGGSRNNANMATPSDGMSPRMQVFLWSGNDARSIALSTNKAPRAGSADFGATAFDITAPVALASPVDACAPVTNAVAGKIVLVHRGTCTFESKAAAVQAAGGVAMLLSNNVAGTTPPHMPEDPATNGVTIGALSTTQADGADLETALAGGTVTATLHRVAATELDGALDATVVAHEFGHYLHHRLSSCDLTAMCSALSEGWGDFSALLLLSHAGDDPAAAYPIGVYATNGFSPDAAYFGIRRAPYSTNPAINGLSFRHMALDEPLPTNQPFLALGENSEPHNAGEVWAQTLWDVYQAILARGPTFAEARARMMRYVVGGLLMTPPTAVPTEARDALLAVMAVGDTGDRDAALAAFARRGMGTCAVAPPRGSTTFTGIVESHDVKGTPTIGAATVASVDSCDDDGILDNGETARVTVPITNVGPVPLTGVVVAATTTTAGLTLGTGEVTVGTIAPGATGEATFDVAYTGDGAPATGELALAITAPDGCGVLGPTSVTLRLDVDDVPASLATDTFDAADSPWQPGGALWIHERETALDGVWHGVDTDETSDQSLVSPPLVADSGPLVVELSHRHSFEGTLSGNFDGGVIEVSTDAGATWRDASELASFVYPGTLGFGGTNPLAGRKAFVGKNPSFPNTDQLVLDFGTQLAGKTFQLRFRIASDEAVGDLGWFIDDIAFSGIVGAPFPAQVGDRGACLPPPPSPEDGGCCDAGPPRAANALWALGVALLLRRRRRSRGVRAVRI